MPSQFNPYLSLFDNSFSEDLARSYTFCCSVNLHGFSYTIYQKQKNKVLGVESFRFEKLKNEIEIAPVLEQLLIQTTLLNAAFQQVIIVFENQFSTLVPLPLFNENDKKWYLEFNQPPQKNNSVDFNVLKNVQAANVFYIPENLLFQLNNKWPEAKIFHFSTALIESLGSHYKYKFDDNLLFLNVRDDSFDLIYFKNKKLFFYNLFKFRTKEDFIYFLLLAMEQLSLNPEEVQLLVSGKIDLKMEIYTILYTYIRNIRFNGRNDSLSYSDCLDEAGSHRDYVLFNALQCE